MTNLDKAIIKYTGKGVGTIPGVPARDMAHDEARQYDISALLKSGLYELEEIRKPKPTYHRKKDMEEVEQVDEELDDEEGELWPVE